ncbi:M20/M25/M40 family metallo-hydrolase [Bacillus ndiopicus]|uniref:M20/M25/M40 family metallo-hydrolase n=1 Tax=Bacillus ndiopicus TaxID=1347368 RepID=UPI0005A74A2C|nr:M20/M25/M40 family metallo-hydrolase [Bacillus ndiopicus]
MLIAKLQEEQQQSISLWEELVNTASGSDNFAGIEQVVNIVLKATQPYITSHQIIQNETQTLILERKGDLQGTILLIGHMDTVFTESQTNDWKFTKDGAFVSGPGVYDMKGGIVQIILALKHLHEIQYKGYTIRVVLFGDEEVGHKYSDISTIMKATKNDAIVCFCCESGRSDQALIVGRDGVAELEMQVSGQSGHAGYITSDTGNAIKQLALSIAEVYAITERYPTVKVSAGLVTGGGATNIVPDYAKVIFDIRYKNNEHFNEWWHELSEAIQAKITATTVSLNLRKGYPPMEMLASNIALFDYMKEIAEANNVAFTDYLHVGGGADSSLYANEGIPTICGIGPWGENLHTVKEKANIQSLFDRTAILIEAILHIERFVKISATQTE